MLALFKILVRFMEFHEAKAKPPFNLQNNPSANHAIARERKGWDERERERERERECVWCISPYFARVERGSSS